MPDDNDTCGSQGCGSHFDIFPTDRVCPTCGRPLQLTGYAQLAEFRLTCPGCGYWSPRLTQAELSEVL